LNVRTIPLDNGKNGSKSLSSPKGPGDDMKWSRNNSAEGIHPGSYSPLDSPEGGPGVASDYGRGPGGGSPVRDRELDSWARNDRSRGRHSGRSRERGRGSSRDRVRESSRENRNDSKSDGNGSRRSGSAQRNPIRSDPSPQYMISTASFASKLKKLRVDNSVVKRKPGMRAGSISTVLKYSSNQRSQSFSSSYNPNKFKSTGTKSDSAQRDYEEYGEDVMEYSGPLSGGNIENSRVSRDNDFSTLPNGTTPVAYTQQTHHIMRSKSTETSKDSRGDRSRTRVAHPVVERESAQLSSSMARDRNSHSSSSVKQGKESLGYVNIYLKEHSLRAHHDTEDRDRDRDRHGRSHSSSGNWNGNSNGNQQAFFSPTLLRRSVDPTRRGSGTGRGRGFSPDHSPSDSLSPSWLDDGDYRQGGSPGGVYTMPHFKRYHEQLGRARGRS
jgi:hypothetical protein